MRDTHTDCLKSRRSREKSPQLLPALGIDWGERHLGFALTDEEGRFCFSRGEEEVRGLREACRAAREKAKEWGARALVIGLPLTLRGEKGKQAQRVLLFADRLRRGLSLPVFLEDERLTSRLARRIVGEQRVSEHAAAACIILRSWLQRRRPRRKSPAPG